MNIGKKKSNDETMLMHSDFLEGSVNKVVSLVKSGSFLVRIKI